MSQRLVLLFVLLLAFVAMPARPDTALVVTPAAGVDQYRSTSKIGTQPDLARCWTANRADAEARKAKLPVTYGCDPQREKGVITWTATPPPPIVTGTWTHAANEWQEFVMPYEGVATFKDAHPLSPRLEMSFPAGQSLRCNNVANGGVFPRPPDPLSWRFVCEIHPKGMVIIEPTVSLTMMAQMPGMPLVDPTKIPAPNPIKSTDLRVRATEVKVSVGNDIGAFRNGCEFSHFNFDDFIVAPGKPGAAHLHMYCGNASADAFSTDVSLAKGASTAVGGTANLSAYWTPALLMPDPNRAGYYLPVIPFGWNNYYKSGYNQIPVATMQPIPNGLKIIAGNSPSNADPATSVGGWSWSCDDTLKGVSIPACAPGRDLTAHGVFPNCWDGKNLDSPDHRSHMAYSGGQSCPASHPVGVVQLSFNVHFRVPANADTTKWKLSCDMGAGGLCLHGDASVLWNTAIRDEWMTGCVYSFGSCQANMGMGRELY
ncbi:MAG: hypothetical protein RL254_1016 [Planctomycetota bacterium]|jgi:hypothetical protein